jgi:hypothetical protein
MSLTTLWERARAEAARGPRTFIRPDGSRYQMGIEIRDGVARLINREVPDGSR